MNKFELINNRVLMTDTAPSSTRPADIARRGHVQSAIRRYRC